MSMLSGRGGGAEAAPGASSPSFIAAGGGSFASMFNVGGQVAMCGGTMEDAPRCAPARESHIIICFSLALIPRLGCSLSPCMHACGRGYHVPPESAALVRCDGRTWLLVGTRAGRTRVGGHELPFGREDMDPARGAEYYTGNFLSFYFKGMDWYGPGARSQATGSLQPLPPRLATVRLPLTTSAGRQQQRPLPAGVKVEAAAWSDGDWAPLYGTLPPDLDAELPRRRP